MLNRRISAVLFAVFISACSSLQPRTTDFGSQLHVVFELCRPNSSAADAALLGYEGITDDGYGGLWIRATRTLASGDPIYYSYTDSPQRLKALVARFSDAKDFFYIFDMKGLSAIKKDQWTSWTKPTVFTTNSKVNGKILRNILYASVALEEPMPKIRATVMRFDAYLKTVKPGASPPALSDAQNCQ